MEIKEWLQVWQFDHNPFVIFDADRDPYLQSSMVENTSLRSVLLHIDKPTPYVIFAIRGAGKSSMRIDTERYLNDYRDQVLVIAYTEYNELISEVQRPRSLPLEYASDRSAITRFLKGKKEIPLPRSESRITLDDHLDHILKLGIEELYRTVANTPREDLLKSNPEIAEKFLLLIALYYATNDLSSKIATLRRLIDLTGYER